MLNDKIKDQIPLFEMPELNNDLTTATDRKKVSGAGKKVQAKRSDPSRKNSASSQKTRMQQRTKSTAAKGGTKESLSGQVPQGDVRLTANIREDLHLKLKITAARRRTTIGDLIEDLVEKHL